MSTWSLALFISIHCCYHSAISVSGREGYSSKEDVQQHDATNMNGLRGRDIAPAKKTDYKDLLLRSRLLSAELKPAAGATTGMKGYSLPLMPAMMPDINSFSSNPFLRQIKGTATTETAAAVSKGDEGSKDKLIPRIIWIAVKDSKDELPRHLTAFISRNPSWTVNICDNKCKDRFMDEAFGGTAVSWAYKAINPLVGAARADIWR